jgi:hypothetical protein
MAHKSTKVVFTCKNTPNILLLMAIEKDEESDKVIRFSVVPWGHINMAELDNAIRAANLSQHSFEFTFIRDIVPIREDRYHLSIGGLDLESAARDLIETKQLRGMASRNFILATSKPYSTPDADIYEESYYFEDRLPFAQNVAIVSTHLWEQLSSNPDLDVLKPDGRRSIIPFLHYCFAMIALDKSVSAPIAYHTQTYGCPFDYCYEPKDIDYFFKIGRFCDDCTQLILKEMSKGKLSVTQFNSTKRLLNLAVGRSVNYGFTSCFISYGEPDKEFAKKLDEGLRSKGIETWMYEMHSTPGKRTWSEIIEKRRAYDKFLVICSAKSLSRDGVLKEIEQQVDENPKKIVPISIDHSWLKPRFVVKRGKYDLKPFLRDLNYADFTVKTFEHALDDLVMALLGGTDTD